MCFQYICFNSQRKLWLCIKNLWPFTSIDTVQAKPWADLSPPSSSDKSVIGVSHLSSVLTTLYRPFSKPREALLVLSCRWAWIRPTGTGIIAIIMSRARTARAQPGYSWCCSVAWTWRERRCSARIQTLLEQPLTDFYRHDQTDSHNIIFFLLFHIATGSLVSLKTHKSHKILIFACMV